MDTKIKTYRPSLALYRANSNGTGSAMKMELHPAHGDTAGCIMVTLASQKTVGDYRGPNPVYPSFDWENAICVKLAYIRLEHLVEPIPGYRIEVMLCDGVMIVEKRAIMLAPYEALGLTAAIESSLGVLCFGVSE